MRWEAMVFAACILLELEFLTLVTNEKLVTSVSTGCLGGHLHSTPNPVVMLFRFAVMSEAVAREYANLAYQQPYQWAMYKAEVSPPSTTNKCGREFGAVHMAPSLVMLLTHSMGSASSAPTPIGMGVKCVEPKCDQS